MESIEPIPAAPKRVVSKTFNWDDLKLIDVKQYRKWSLLYVDLDNPALLTTENVAKFAAKIYDKLLSNKGPGTGDNAIGLLWKVQFGGQMWGFFYSFTTWQ